MNANPLPFPFDTVLSLKVPPKFKRLALDSTRKLATLPGTHPHNELTLLVDVQWKQEQKTHNTEAN